MTRISVTDEAKPLVTFSLLAYNQENYIREAVEGALAQTYEPLEIILSDDCSADRTFEIINEMAANYRGPHRVMVRRNRINAGIAGHVNQVFEAASGAVVVVSAGDDISYPQRTSMLVSAWQREGRPEAAIHSSSRAVDLNGKPKGVFKHGSAANPELATLQSFVSNGFHSVLHGATCAYTPGLIDLFGALTSDFEDAPLTFRALLAGRLIYVDEVLLDYRVGQGVSRSLRRKDRTHVVAWIGAQLSRIRCHRLDYVRYCEVSGVSPDDKIAYTLAHLERRFQLAAGMGSSNLLRNLAGLLALPMRGSLRDRLHLIATYFGFKK